MAWHVPPSAPSVEEWWQPPRTDPDLDGPHRGGPWRPPTTGLLPPQGYGSGPILLATDSSKDSPYVRSALWFGRMSETEPLRLDCCCIGEAPAQVLSLQPSLIIIADHTALRWGAQQMKLCRLLKRTWRLRIPVIVLYSGRRVLGHTALAEAAPDPIIPASTLAPMFFLSLTRLLGDDPDRAGA